MTSARSSAVLPVLYLAALLSYIDRIIFSLALEPLKEQFAFSDSQLGLLAGLAFGISYALFSPIAGWFADKSSRKIVLLVAVTGWSAATLATAYASSFTSMFIARALVGMGEAAVMPLAVSMISDTRAPELRSRAFGIFLSASALGTAMGMIFGGGVMTAIAGMGGVDWPVFGQLQPWQVLFVTAAALGLIFVVVVSFVLRDPPRQKHAGPLPVEDSQVWRFVTNNRLLLFTLYIGLSLIQMSTITNLVWIVPAIGRAHGLAAGDAALTVGMTIGLAMLAGSLVTGRVIAALKTRGDIAAPLTVCLASGTIFAVFSIIGLFMTELTWALVFLTIGTFFAYAPTISALSVVGEAVPAPIRARLAGFNTMSNAIICNSLGSLLVGIFGDRLFPGDMGITISLASVIALGLILGGGIVIAGMPTYRRRMQIAARSEGGYAH